MKSEERLKERLTLHRKHLVVQSYIVDVDESLRARIDELEWALDER